MPLLFCRAAVRFKAPMALYATAGLRLIDPAAAESILSNVRALIGGTGFAFEAANVMIMDGKKEVRTFLIATCALSSC